MKRITLLLLLCCSCAEKKVTSTCLDYATALLGMCFDAVERGESQLQCDSGLLEAGYNACYMALETNAHVCVPYRDQGFGDPKHACSSYVWPPAPPNWRGEKRDPMDTEREP